MQPRDGRIVIIDGQLSEERTTRALFTTLEMLISRAVWTSTMACIATQIVVAGCCYGAGVPSHITLAAALATGGVGVVIKGIVAWHTARKWRETISNGT